MSASSKDYAKRLAFEESIINDSYPTNVSRDVKLKAFQGQALRATIAAATGEIVDAIRATHGLQPFDQTDERS